MLFLEPMTKDEWMALELADKARQCARNRALPWPEKVAIAFALYETGAKAREGMRCSKARLAAHRPKSQRY